jgi:protein O-mannosyl-transferase
VSAPADVSRTWRASWLACVGVAAVAAAAYATTLHAYFAADDFGLIKVLHGKPLRHFFSLFTGSWTDDIYGVRPDELRPFIALSYQLDALRGAAFPPAYHAGSIALHAACSVLVVLLARVGASATWMAAAAAGLIFAVHPAHAEAVAWISGRADSIPTLFFLGSLIAYAAWRQRPRAGAYAASLVLFFCALFSKQSAIVMPAVLLAFELLVRGRREQPWRRWLGPVAPFAALTAGYLALRQLLFGNYVREQLLTVSRVQDFLRRQPAYTDALLSPAIVTSETVTTRGVVLLALGVVACALLALAAWRSSDAGPRTLLFFCPVWYVLTVGPLLVTYFSARHLYLPSAGIAVAWGALIDLVSRRTGPRWRAACLAACLVAAVAYTVTLHRHNRRWNDAARVSQVLATEAHRVAMTAPPGSLIVVDAPWRTRHAYIWAWAVPFVMQQPFAAEDLTRRVGVVSHSWAYCCPARDWLADLKLRLGAWAARPGRVYVVLVSAPGPRARTVSDDQAPALAAALRAVASGRTPEEAETRLQDAVGLALRASP